MISKEDFLKAKETVVKYRNSHADKCLKGYTCCCCKKEKITLVDGDIASYENEVDILKQDGFMWNNGAVTRVSFGYGSKHDMETMFVAICDNCFEDLRDQGLSVDYKELYLKKKDNER